MKKLALTTALTVLAALSMMVASADVPIAPDSLVFGTNLLGEDSNDPIFDTDVQDAFDEVHITTVRFPIRDEGCATTEEVDIAEIIEARGWVPMVILKFTQAEPGAAALCVVGQMNTVFGSDVVYYEWGNERDLAGVSATTYTNTWNNSDPDIGIASAIAAANNGLFGGPTNYHADPTYVAYFVDNANPKPDFVSWHEYTCGPSDSAAVCLSEIQDWEVNVADTRTAIANTGETVPPVCITEWNYDAQVAFDANDSRLTQQFITDFYTDALQELVNADVHCAHHYRGAGHEPYELVENAAGDLSQQGIAFEAMFDVLVDSDGDGCTNAQEDGSDLSQGGQRDKANPWDFFDTPVPALQQSDTSGVRNRAVTQGDALAVYFYAGTVNNGGPNSNGVDYDTDLNGNGVEDGVEYDRVANGQISAQGNGAVTLADALVANTQNGDSCI